MSAKVLVISDDTDLKSHIQQMLEPQGYELTLVTFLPEALEKVAQEPPDLVVLDGALPDRWSDWQRYDQEFMKQLRGIDNPHRPRVLVLYMRRQNEGMFVYKTGPDGYYQRPEVVRSPQGLPDQGLKGLIKRLLNAPPFEPDLEAA